MRKIFLILGLILSATFSYAQYGEEGEPAVLQEVIMNGYKVNNHDFEVWLTYLGLQNLLNNNNNFGTGVSTSSGTYTNGCQLCDYTVTYYDGQITNYSENCNTIANCENQVEEGCDNPVFDKNEITMTKSDNGKPPLGSLDYGLTSVNYFYPTYEACLSGSNWIFILHGLEVEYSSERRLFPGQIEITGIGGNTNESNYCIQASSLKNLGNGISYNASSGTYSGEMYYMLSAVDAHENLHVSRILPLVRELFPNFETGFESISIPNTGQSKQQAQDALQTLPAFTTFMNDMLDKYKNKWNAQGTLDHAGPTDVAERAITEPMKTNICNHAKTTTPPWAPCSSSICD